MRSLMRSTGILRVVILGAKSLMLPLGRSMAFSHLAQNMQPSVLGLAQGLGHDLLADSADLDVHLHGGDAFFGAGHFEVHVAQVILVAQDVGQNRHPCRLP